MRTTICTRVFYFSFCEWACECRWPWAHIRFYFILVLFLPRNFYAGRMDFLNSLPYWTRDVDSNCLRHHFRSFSYSLCPSSSHSSVPIFRRVIYTDFPLPNGRFLSNEHTPHVQTPNSFIRSQQNRISHRCSRSNWIKIIYNTYTNRFLFELMYLLIASSYSRTDSQTHTHTQRVPDNCFYQLHTGIMYAVRQQIRSIFSSNPIIVSTI